MVKVYGLRSSEDQRIRYIGQTVASLRGRLGSHIRCARKWPRRRLSYWIAKTHRMGFAVEIVALRDDAVWNETERALIAQYRAAGHDLVNATDGGEGNLGHRWTDEQRAAQSLRMQGKKKSPEHIAKMAATLRGRHPSPEAIAKQRATMKGRSPKNLLSIQAGNRGIGRPPELRRRISASLKGRQVTATEKLLANLEKARGLAN